VLSLFCEIDNSVLRTLAQKCDKFINTVQAEENQDEVESNQDMEEQIAIENEEDDYVLLGQSGQRKKIAKGRTTTSWGFYFKISIELIIILAYFLQNFLLNTDAAEAAIILGKELNQTCKAEPFYWFALNTQRELLNNPDKAIILRNSLSVALEN
jgi:hypothetical protein